MLGPGMLMKTGDNEPDRTSEPCGNLDVQEGASAPECRQQQLTVDREPLESTSVSG